MLPAITPPPKAHPQFILAALNAYFSAHGQFQNALNRYSASDWLDEVQPHLIIGQRQALEVEPLYRQLLPYIIVRQRGTDGVLRYLPFRRTEQVGEVRLAKKVSIGYGGHIDLADVVFDEKSVILLFDTIVSAAYRELVVEELKTRRAADAARLRALEIAFSDEFILDSDEVGRVHVAILMVADLPGDLDLESGEDELVSLPPMSRAELLASGLEMESWTRIYLDHHPET